MLVGALICSNNDSKLIRLHMSWIQHSDIEIIYLASQKFSSVMGPGLSPFKRSSWDPFERTSSTWKMVVEVSDLRTRPGEPTWWSDPRGWSSYCSLHLSHHSLAPGGWVLHWTGKAISNARLMMEQREKSVNTRFSSSWMWVALRGSGRSVFPLMCPRIW